MFDSDTTITSVHLAKLLGCDERTIRNYARRGLLIKAGRGRYRLIASCQALYRNLAALAAGRGKSIERLDVAVETAALKKAQRKLTDLKRRHLEGALIPIEEIEPAWARVVRAARQSVLAIPNNARFRLPHLTIHDGGVLMELCREALEEASGSNPLPPNRGEMREDEAGAIEVSE